MLQQERLALDELGAFSLLPPSGAMLSRDAVETVRALFERTDDCADLRIEAASLEDALSTLTASALKEAA